jgi:hypothetical protein
MRLAHTATACALHAGGYHPVRVGEKFKQGRYVVLKKLGWGHFSTVWLVLDTTNHTFAALKVRGAAGVDCAGGTGQCVAAVRRAPARRHATPMCARAHTDTHAPHARSHAQHQVQKSAQHYSEAARDEITLLSQIRGGDPANAKHCCRLLDSFEHAGPHGLHVCMVFEVLGDNLLSLIKAFDYKGVPLPVVRTLTRQMLVGLDYLHRCVVSRIVVQAERTQHRHVHSLVTCSTCGSYSCPAQEWRSWRVPKQLCSCAQLSRILVALVNALQGKLGLKCPASGQVLSMRLSH